MPEGATVETNFVVDVVLEQHAGATRLLESAERGVCVLYLPVVSVGESIKVVESRLAQWREFGTRLRDTAAQMSRSGGTRALAESLTLQARTVAQLDDHFNQRLWDALSRLARTVQPLPFTEQAATLARELSDSLNLSLADAAIMASVVEQGSKRGVFISRDKKDFDNAGVKRYLADKGIRLMTDPDHFLASLP